MISTVLTTMAVTTVAGAVIRGLLRQIRRHWAARTVIQRTQSVWDTPVPYWPATGTEIAVTNAMLLTMLCRPCRDGDQTGTCTCTVPCGQLECLGGFSDDDIKFLYETAPPEGDSQ